MSRAETLPFVVLGNPDNRRVALFQAALGELGHAPARVVSWLDFLRDPSALADALAGPAWLRVDSFGESFEVERTLLRMGWEAARHVDVERVEPASVDALAYERGRILAPRQLHLGFERGLGQLEGVLARRPDVVCLNEPASVARLFDKRACATLFAELGVPMAPPLPAAPSPDDLRDAMTAAGVGRAFVKLSCGSSASCLALFARDAPGGEWLFTSMEVEGGVKRSGHAPRLYNSLRPRRYRDRPTVDHLLAYLLREGSHVEALVPKARVGGSYFDCRVLVVAGEAAFTVMRKSRHPMTNLHLGGVRGTHEELRARVGDDALRAAYESCERVARAHRCLHVGVDVMFEPSGAHRVLEADAFGDLLPNLERDGLGVYAWQVRALTDGRWPAQP